MVQGRTKKRRVLHQKLGSRDNRETMDVGVWSLCLPHDVIGLRICGGAFHAPVPGSGGRPEGDKVPGLSS